MMKANSAINIFIGLALASVSGTAMAQAEPAAPTDSAETSGEQEIIVTAQRREEALSRTPVAVTAISSDMLAKNAIVTQVDLQVAAPGLVVKASGNSNDLNYAIRGQSLDAYSGTRPGVLPYFNEVQIGGQGTSSSFYDLQSVQVLKGPQGTLFGRNSTGGAVLFTSAQPSYEFGGYASALAGNFDTFKLEGAVNAPIISDLLAVRVAGFYSTNEGYQRNLFTGRKLGDSDRLGVRGSVRLDVTDSIRNDLVLDYYKADGTSMSSVLGSLNANAPFPITALYSGATFPAGQEPATGPVISDFVLSQLLQSLGLPSAAADAAATGNYASFVASFNNPAVPFAGIGQILADQQANGPWVANSNSPSLFRTKNFIVTNATTIDLTDTLTLKNIFGYTDLRSFSNVEYDGTPYRISDTGNDPAQGNFINAKQYSEELQLSGTALNDALDFVTGFYYSREYTTNYLHSENLDILLGGISQFIDYKRTNTTYAGYTQGTYDFGGGFSATAGARYTSERVRNETLPRSFFFNDAINDPVNFDNDQARTFKNVSWTLGLQYQVNSDLLLYVKNRRSYKNGGFNGQASPRIGFGEVNGSSYRTETLTDAEVGMKFSGRVGDMRTHLNIAGYHNWITNSQRTAYALTAAGGLAAVSVTVPKARVWGIEVDGDISPAEGLTIGGSVNYTNPKFTDGLTAVAGSTALFATYPDVSKWSGAAYANVSVPVTNAVDAVFRAEMFGQTRQYYYSAANLNPGTELPGYVLANFRVGIETDSGFSIMANLKNAFETEYFVGGLPIGGLLATNTLIPGMPRTFTVEARMKF
jgi:iron complex outermembrane receptor protein